MLAALYRLTAAACAAAVWRVPALERPFAAIGARVWNQPGVGRFYRSAADRLATRLRRGGAPLRSVNVKGHRLVLDATEFTTAPLYFGGALYEPKTTDCFLERLKPGGVFVDIGANHGYFSMLAAALVGPTGRVVAFEPNPKVFRQLETHIRANHFESRVTALPYAVADAPADNVQLYVSQIDNNSGLSSLMPNQAALDSGDLSAAATVSVTVQTFDGWLATSGVDRIDLVKIDVEGAEARVVKGMARALAEHRVDAVVCETMWDGPTHRLLLESGYAPQMLDLAAKLANVLYVRPSR